MTIDEYIAELQEIKARQSGGDSDVENDHREADRILCRIIYNYVPKGREIIHAFGVINKWYC